MFGYIQPRKSELRLREYDVYRALYCGLCRHMGKCTGNCSRLSLSYDMVFLASVRMALSGEVPAIAPIHCLLHPFRRRSAVKNSPVLAYCADASALLTYGKIKDDLADESGAKRLRAALALPFFRPAWQKAKKRRPELAKSIAEKLSALSELERSPDKLPSVDLPASLFGSLMGDVFSEGLEGVNAKIAHSLGGSVGHWLYLADALDDFEEDKKKKRFNPLQKVYGDELSPEARGSISDAMLNLLGDAESALLLVDGYPTPELKEILLNQLYLGLPDATKRVQDGKKPTKKQKKGTTTR